jgi:hypothetical protein
MAAGDEVLLRTRRVDARDIDQLLGADGITSRVGEDVFDRPSPTEVISEKVTRQLQARRASPDKQARRYMAIDGKSIHRNGRRLIEHRATSTGYCHRPVAKGLDRLCQDSAFAI